MGQFVFTWSLGLGLFLVVSATWCPPWSKGLQRSLVLGGLACVAGGAVFLAFASFWD